MYITDKILSILRSMESLKTVIYDSGFSSNVRIDRQEDPIGLLYLLTDWNLDISSGLKKEAADIEVFFCKRGKFDAKGEEKDVIVTEMAAIAEEFISRVLADSELKVEDDSITMRSSWGKFDAFCLGVSVKLRVTEKQGNCI